jgi:hypothetical protein
VEDVILIAGQSNAVGADTHPADLPKDAGDAQVPFWFRTGDPPPDDADSRSAGWTTLQPQPLGSPKRPRNGKTRQYGNFADPAGGFGPEMGLARHLRAAQPERALSIVKAAFSGTGFSLKDWNPGDPCYVALVNETRAALEAAAKSGRSTRLRAIIWVQGESDARAADAPLYKERLGRMFEALRSDLKAPELKAVMAVNTRFGAGKNAFMPEIVKQQQALAASDPRRCVYVDTAAATTANAAHYDTAGTLKVGQWMAEALLKLEEVK